MTRGLGGLKMSFRVMNICAPMYLFWPYILCFLQTLYGGSAPSHVLSSASDLFDTLQ